MKKVPSQILFAFLATRILVLVFYLNGNPPEIQPLTRENFLQIATDGYAQIAYNIVQHGKYQYIENWTVHNRPPLHPLIMSFSFVFPKYWFVFWFATTFLLQFIALVFWRKLLFFLFKRKLLNRFAVIGLTAFFLLHPYAVLPVRTTTFLNEAILLLILWTYSLARVYFENKGHYSLAATAALAALTHGSLQIVPVLTLVFLLLQKTKTPKILLATTIMLAFLLPWTIRNYYNFGYFFPLYTGAGAQYWKGEESALGKDDIEIKLLSKELGKPAPFLFYSTQTPRQDKILLKLALNDIKENPTKLLKRFFIGLYMFWAPYERGFLKSFLLAMLNFPVVLLTFFSWLRNGRKTNFLISFLMVFLSLLWTIFAFFAANASFFAMCLPLLFLCFHYFLQDEPLLQSLYSRLFPRYFARRKIRKFQSRKT